MKQASDHKFIIAQELQVSFYLKKTMKGGLAVIVLVGAFIIAAEGACPSTGGTFWMASDSSTIVMIITVYIHNTLYIAVRAHGIT